MLTSTAPVAIGIILVVAFLLLLVVFRSIAIAVTSIILGTLGLFNGCVAAVFIGAQGMFMSFMEEISKQPGGDPTQLELMRAAIDVQQQNLVLILITLGISFVVSLGMFFGGIVGAMKKPSSVMILKVVFALAILSNIVSLPINLYNTQLTATAQGAALEKMEIDEAQRQIMNTSQTFGFWIGLGTAIAFSLAMIGLYVASLLYLIRSRKLAAYMAARTVGYK